MICCARRNKKENKPHEEEPETTDNLNIKNALETLSQHEAQLWIKVNALIERKQNKAYEEAVQILLQLKDVASYQGTKPFLKDISPNSRKDTAGFPDYVHV